MDAIRRRAAVNLTQEQAMTTETEEAEDGPGAAVPEPVAPPDEKELLQQRRMARIEEALGLSPLT